jgi:hypothetical protein
MCDSCGDDDADLTSVRRVFLSPAAWDKEEERRESETVEQWCAVCMVHYPRLVID